MESNHRQFKLGLIHILLTVAILAGSVLRFARLKEIPPGFDQDEAVNGYDAYSLFLTGRDHHGHPFPFAGLESFGDWVSPLLTFITQRPALGVAAALTMALSPWAVARSRFAIPPALVPLMVTLLMLALVWTMQHQSNRGFVALGIIAALTMASYPTMKLYVPLLLLAGFLIYARTLLSFSRESLLYAAILFISIAGPLMYLSLVDPGGKARFDQVSVFNSGKASVLFLAQQYGSYFSPWVFFSLAMVILGGVPPHQAGE